jgi:hypothetical protein
VNASTSIEPCRQLKKEPRVVCRQVKNILELTARREDLKPAFQISREGNSWSSRFVVQVIPIELNILQPVPFQGSTSPETGANVTVVGHGLD